MCDRCGWSGEERCARQVCRDSDHQQRTSGFLAGLPGRGNVALHRDSGKQQHRQNRAADHPAHGNSAERRRTGLQHIVEAEVANRLNDAGENKTKGENQRGAIVRATKTNQRIRGIAEAEQNPADFEIEVDFGRARNVRVAQIENRAKEENAEGKGGSREDARRLLPEKPDDFASTPHENPQMPENTEETATRPEECTFMPFLA